MKGFIAGVVTTLAVLHLRNVVEDRIREARALEAAHAVALAFQATVRETIAARKERTP